jgi:glycosyltransferase involved in cell wall biosynthesis
MGQFTPSQKVSPMVSVVLPTYNRAAYLGRAIQSVLAQTHTNLELIVVDDGSGDDTAAVVAGIADERLRYLRLDQNAGVSAARNHGVRAARSVWVTFQDSDDEWLPDKLARQQVALASLGEDYSVVMCCARCPEDPAFSYDPLQDRAPLFDAAALVLRRLPPAPCWFARREAVLRAGLFDESLNCFEDWELALRLSEFYRVGLLNEVLHIYHRTPGSLFSNEAGYVRNLKLILERHQAKWADHPHDLAMYQTLIGHMACLHGSATEGRGWFRRAIVTAWRAPRAWLSLAASLCGRRAYRAITATVRRGRRSFRPWVED